MSSLAQSLEEFPTETNSQSPGRNLRRETLWLDIEQFGLLTEEKLIHLNMGSFDIEITHFLLV
jgi:hypothetical protein